MKALLKIFGVVIGYFFIVFAVLFLIDRSINHRDYETVIHPYKKAHIKAECPICGTKLDVEYKTK